MTIGCGGAIALLAFRTDRKFRLSRIASETARDLQLSARTGKRESGTVINLVSLIRIESHTINDHQAEVAEEVKASKLFTEF